MSRVLTHKCKSAIAGALIVFSSAIADEGFSPQDFSSISVAPQELSPITAVPEDLSVNPELKQPLTSPPFAVEPIVAQPIEAPVFAPPPPVKKEIPFTAFTGKVKGRKVRMRLKPDLDSHIVKELSKGDLVAVIGEKENFWVIEAPTSFKAYVFRSFVLDNVVEGNHVNIRLQPNTDSPVIGQLNSGEKVLNSSISAKNNKWLEIAAPSHLRFFVAKDLIEFAGGPEMKGKMDARRSAAEKLLDASSLLTKTELKKSFEEIDIDRLNQGYCTVIDEYSEFPEYVEQAKESLASLQENYAQLRLTYEEAQAAAIQEEKIAASSAKKLEPVEVISLQIAKQVTDKMKLWEPVEESLYLTWASMNNFKNIDEFYEDQKLTSITLSGILEAYVSPVKNKPGDFIIRDNDLPVAYVYSTQVNLSELVGKKVTVHGSERPNNNFAFPAFFVLAVE